LDRSQRVSQTFCSALSVGSGFGTDATDWESFARVVLEGIYEATLWAAVVNSQKLQGQQLRVHLPFVGFGAFGNKIEWIVDAMNRAINKLHEAGISMEVVVTHWRDVNPELKAAICVGAPAMGTKPDWICPGCEAPTSWILTACKWCHTHRPDGSPDSDQAVSEAEIPFTSQERPIEDGFARLKSLWSPDSDEEVPKAKCNGGCGFFGLLLVLCAALSLSHVGKIFSNSGT